MVFDSLLRFHSADENSATEMKVAMGCLRDLVTAGATVVVLHHRSKSETSTYRGSSDILKAPTSVLRWPKPPATCPPARRSSTALPLKLPSPSGGTSQ